MICSVVIASALILTPAKAPTYHSVQFFDNRINLSNRVLDRSICKDVERVYPLTTEQGAKRVEEKVQLEKKANLANHQAHCSKRVLAEGKNDGECRLTK